MTDVVAAVAVSRATGTVDVVVDDAIVVVNNSLNQSRITGMKIL